MNELENLIKFHEYVFGKNPSVMWDQLNANPAEALEAILQMGSHPQLQTMETGFILGAVLMYGMRHDPLAVQPMLNAMSFKLGVKKHGK